MPDLLLPPAGRILAAAPFMDRPAPAIDEGRLFLHVRVVAADAAGCLLQYALADGLGQVRISLFARLDHPAPDPALPLEAPRPGRLTPSVVSARELDHALRICRGCDLVAFGRLPQGALLTPSARVGALSLDCARTRFLKVARRRGLAVQPQAIVGVNDALGLAGLPPVRSPDAALRALGLRQLCLWMDGLG